MQRRIMPDIVRGQSLCCLPPAATVREAAKLMAQRHVGAVMVTEGDRLVGIFSERDLSKKVVAAGADPDRVTLAQAMTPDPDTIAPEGTADDALRMMRDHGYRHLPVTRDGKVVGMVSVRDLYDAVLHELEDEIHDRDAFIHGVGYGGPGD
jgi:CBS domain-containing protein